MASTSRRTPVLLLVAAAALLVAAGSAVLAGAQTPATQTCASKLVPCANYLNSTSPPPDTCCNPIRETVKNDRACLCTLYTTPGLLASLGINVTQALQLTKECGVPTDTSSCNATATPPSSSTTPPATPGGDSDAGRIAWSGISSLFLILASMMFY
ncbi:non-specific lipid transfer protein GPI-anchored 7-like [Syzygium oleosum]|uniref:non-specific lipid transfer protein GPI-anchored 7-like n=1 Tax=Syzygium oleosum TaxID=219896 RepID=UPI0024B8E213|nr:non-specific lipid transfer protein GPI-anchored 7-like [Syzygium oleosum]XP_056160612.1 non-specific lipid transfer protein GPI-anchored 7-like [Syzygium oleosum]